MPKKTTIWLAGETKQLLKQLLRKKEGETNEYETYDSLIRRLVTEHVQKYLGMPPIFFMIHYVDGDDPLNNEHEIVFQIFGNAQGEDEEGLQPQYFHWKNGQVMKLSGRPKMAMKIVEMHGA